MFGTNRGLICATVLTALVAVGCVSPGQLEKLKTELTAQIAQSEKAQQAGVTALKERIGKIESNQQLQAERHKGLEERTEQVAKIPRELEAAVAAVMNYARDVEKSIQSLRDLTARELDRQNTHIQQVKTSYGAVLEQEIRNLDTMAKTIEATMAGLKTTLQNSVTTLKQALPAAGETIPPAPPLPSKLGKGKSTPGGQPPKPPLPPPPPVPVPKPK